MIWFSLRRYCHHCSRHNHIRWYHHLPRYHNHNNCNRNHSHHKHRDYKHDHRNHHRHCNQLNQRYHSRRCRHRRQHHYILINIIYNFSLNITISLFSTQTSSSPPFIHSQHLRPDIFQHRYHYHYRKRHRSNTCTFIIFFIIGVSLIKQESQIHRWCCNGYHKDYLLPFSCLHHWHKIDITKKTNDESKTDKWV